MGCVPCRICTPVDRLARRIVHEIAVDLEAPDAPDLGNRWTGHANQHGQHHEPCPLEGPFRRNCLRSHSSSPSLLQASGPFFRRPRCAYRALTELVWRAIRGLRAVAAVVSTAQAFWRRTQNETSRPARTREQPPRAL